MIIGAYLQHAAPGHPAGAEWTIQDAFSWLVKRGHDCRVMATEGYTRERVGGVLVYCEPTGEETVTHFQECDVMLTQLGGTMRAQLLAATYQAPLVQYVHSATQLDDLGVLPGVSALVLCNTRHVAEACAWWPGDLHVLHPPVDAERVRVEAPGSCTTMVNTSLPKGGMHFWRLAKALEGFPFLGVQGAWGEQALAPDGLSRGNADEPSTGLPANLRVMAPLLDVREALRFTRTLLMLSSTETYGRIAVEAAVSGIPTIAVDTPGLREAMGDAAQYIASRDDEAQLSRLLQRSYGDAWQEWSRAAQEHAGRVIGIRQVEELHAFERALVKVKKEQPEMTL